MLLVDVDQLVDSLNVSQVVAGSSPVIHPLTLKWRSHPKAGAGRCLECSRSL